MAETPCVLIVEDDPDILNLLTFTIQNQGYSVLQSKHGEEGLITARTHRPDMILLDLMLPGMDGIAVCRALKDRAETARIPVIMLTAKGEEGDRILGLETGADDYVVKPFSPRELVLRVEAVLRRSRDRQEQEAVWEYAGLRVEMDAFQATLDGRELELTSTEFHLLAALIRSRGRVLTREQLLDQVWGYEFDGYARTVDTHMHRLRHKLGRAAEWIQTVRGVGYRLKKAGEA
ncbi:response regulator [Desulfovermiculus halophilus]|uniref:response regulator n=1 Tax=Desulfovermiculus halophilus TaxID=339722 RepID=UPI00048063D4|nr:response regulator [Desulfovermiculus halophilus]